MYNVSIQPLSRFQTSLNPAAYSGLPFNRLQYSLRWQCQSGHKPALVAKNARTATLSASNFRSMFISQVCGTNDWSNGYKHLANDLNCAADGGTDINYQFPVTGLQHPSRLAAIQHFKKRDRQPKMLVAKYEIIVSHRTSGPQL
tara:strand:+ start:68 stop:499 length:432 start_codon:yes stop_codon:yes gene_type:complete